MEDNFKLLAQLDTNPNIEISKCKHENIIIENHKKICEECGIDVEEIVSFQKEWRYYGTTDSRLYSDPNRCQARKILKRSIRNDIMNMSLSERIIDIADDLYNNVAQGIHRGKSRKGIVFACVFSRI